MVMLEKTVDNSVVCFERGICANGNVKENIFSDAC